MKRLFFIIFCSSFLSITLLAQDNIHLRQYIEVVKNLQNANKSKNVYNNAINTLSDPDMPLLTILDNIGDDKTNEYSKKDKDPFRLNSVITHAYHIQNGEETSRGNYYDSREVGIDYSMIEKSIKPKSTASYSITGHSGMQEFVFIPFDNKNSSFIVSISVNGKKFTPQTKHSPTLYQYIKIGNVNKSDIIKITINNQSKKFNSFAIINHNSKK